MSKDKISDYSATANSNTDIAGINIDEGCAPSGINNAIRTLMKQIKDLYAGTSGDKWPVTAGGTGATTAADARTNLGLAIGTDVQAYDAQLTDIAGLTPTDNGVVIGNGTNFVVESGATLKTSLGLTIGTDVQAYNAELQGISQGGNIGFKNRIINGAMMIDQRNAGASVTAGSTYPVDRFSSYRSGGTGAYTAQQSSTVPTGFKNSIVATVTSAGTSNEASIYQVIEGYNVADMGFGAAGASTFTLSFWVRSSVTGTYSVSFRAAGGARSYVSTYVISSANTWEQKTVTVAGDTSGSWNTTNGAGLIVDFSLGQANLTTSTLNAWQAGNYVFATGATNLLATNGATFYITGVQLEKGSTATSFDYRPYGTELALCQRYYYTATASAMGCLSATKTFIGYWALPTSMRTKPSVAQSGTVTVYGVNFADFGTSNPALNTDFGVSGGVVNFSGASTAGGSVGLGAWVYGSGTLQFSAEL